VAITYSILPWQLEFELIQLLISITNKILIFHIHISSKFLDAFNSAIEYKNDQLKNNLL